MVKHRIISNLICISLMVIIITNTILPSFSYAEDNTMKDFATEYYGKYEEYAEDWVNFSDYICDQMKEVLATQDIEIINEIAQEYKNILDPLYKLMCELDDNDYEVDGLSDDSKRFLDTITTDTEYIEKFDTLFGVTGLILLSRLYFLNNPNEALPNDEKRDALKSSLDGLGHNLIDDYTTIKDTINVSASADTFEDITDQIDVSGNTTNVDRFANALDGVLGLISYPLKLLLLLPGLLGQAIMSLFMTGYEVEDSSKVEGSSTWLTVDNILFNQLALTDINIFSENVYLISGPNAEIIESRAPDTVLTMRASIAKWYYAFRNLAIVLSLLMLIYIGIRIALTNLAEKKAEYKKMLVNWFTGFSLIFVLHYIIIIVILINNSVIQILARTNLKTVNYNDDYNAAMDVAYSYLTYGQDYEETVDSNGNTTRMYDKDILIEIVQDTRELVNNASDDLEAKAKVDENRDFLYNIAILLKNLEKVGYDYTKLNGTSKKLFDNITYNLDTGQKNYKYDNLMSEKLGKGGAVLFTQMVYLRNMKDNNCSDENWSYTTTYLKEAGESYVKAHNQFVNSYYNINSNTQDSYGLIQVDDSATLKEDKSSLEQTLNDDWNNMTDVDLVPGIAMRNYMKWELVKVEAGNEVEAGQEDGYEDLMNKLFEQSWWIDLTISWTSAILYVILVIITFIMLIMFIKRLITVSILVVVAPLIGITYSIDKSGDNKSQIVDTWLKEFVYNVFIQVAYAASYLVFGKIAMDIACADLSLGSTVLAILSMISMFMGVKIIKQIFGFDKASNLVEQLAMGAVISKTISNVKKGAKNTKGFIDKRAKLKQEQQDKELLKNVPKYTADGKSTDELVKQLKKEKADEELKSKMANKEANRGKNVFSRMASKMHKRPLRNAPKIFSAPARMTKAVAGEVFKLDELGNMVGKINDKINGKQEVTVSAPEVFSALLNNYVKVSNKRSNTTMTVEQFEQNMERVKNAQYGDLTREEASLREILRGMNKKLGATQTQTIISHFKDEKWGSNGTNS